jgi:hypothetical protein
MIKFQVPNSKFQFASQWAQLEREHLLSPSLSSILNGGEGGRRPGEEVFSVLKIKARNIIFESSRPALCRGAELKMAWMSPFPK